MTTGILLTQKDIPEKKQLLGQYFTPTNVVQYCLSNTKHYTNYIIEPSCGNGQFLYSLRSFFSTAKICGIEIDPTICPDDAVCQNFYDYDEVFEQPVTFIGNPPYRTPAFSLSDRREVVKGLMSRYGITGMREEAVFFIVKTVDLILRSNVPGYIHYILPRTIFNNNSPSYTSFITFLRRHTKLLQVCELDQEFAGVSKDLIYVSWAINDPTAVGINESDVYGVGEDFINFHNIFKVTNLGSVPCESIFLSVAGEPKENFKSRLCKIFTSKVNEDNLVDHLSYGNTVHLTALKSRNPAKIKVVTEYIDQVKALPDFDPAIFAESDSYKSIQHRTEHRFYFRNRFLKKASFVYELNRNPCPSFYFPGNPNKGSTDYFGFCEYDVNRNSSPGANRTVPVASMADNLHDSFKEYWNAHTDRPYEKIFDYLLVVAKSDWYRMMKRTYQRFYFGVPREFIPI